MFQFIRNNTISRAIAVFLMLEMLLGVFLPLRVMALTGGPSQPEVQSFEPVATSQMVDLFTGDMTYNIPLMDVGGYPINISYHSGAAMDEEASWVGLGWNINPGVVNRGMRGLPDDMSGDNVTQDLHVEPNKTYGADIGLNYELAGTEFLDIGLGVGVGIKYNNYTGIGTSLSLSPSIGFHTAGSEPSTATLGVSLNTNEEGLDLSPSITFSKKNKRDGDRETKVGLKIGATVNSRAGLRGIQMRAFAQEQATQSKDKDRDGKVSEAEGKAPDVKVRGGYSGGGNISLTPSTYVPQIDLPRTNFSFSFTANLGADVILGSSSAHITGYYSENRLTTSSRTLPAYGYFYTEKSNGGGRMLDFNREKDAPFNPGTSNLPITNFTYDTYTVLGQGIGSTFRPFRGDVSFVHDPATQSPSGSGSLGLQIDGGSVMELGIDAHVNTVSSSSGAWVGENTALLALRNRDLRSFADATHHRDPLYEPFYFKEAGERTVNEDDILDSDGTHTEDLYNRKGGDRAVRVRIHPDDINSSTFRARTTAEFESETGEILPMVDGSGRTMYRSDRDKRDQNISYLTRDEYQKLYPGALMYPSGAGLGHHLRQITCTNNEGARYVYGLPAYNNSQKSVTFNMSGLALEAQTSIITYSSGDNSTGNSRGRDHYYNATNLPAYAHSYLLTEVLSSDYEDSDGLPGPSSGDIGTYTQITYKDGNEGSAGLQPSIANYKWRVPYASNSANFDRSVEADLNDDKASYLYGTKDIWYVKTIATRTHIAKFYTSERADGHAVSGENGGASSTTMFKLDSVALYALPEYLAAGDDAAPIRVAHFLYDYTLCPGVHNNPGSTVTAEEIPTDPADAITPGTTWDSNASGGKLTLRKIWFTYGHSRKGVVSPYIFYYHDSESGDAGNQPEYDLKAYDRWGNFKPESTDPLDPTNADFPYVTQGDAVAQAGYASAWQLEKIFLPSGGVISMEYESDDYAYVQDQRAMQMVRITSAGEEIDSDPEELLFGKASDTEDDTPNLYLFFDPAFPTEIDSGTETEKSAWVRDNYIQGMLGKPMAYKFRVKVTRAVDTDRWEYITGYANLASAGYDESSDRGYLELEAATVGDDEDDPVIEANPISKSSWAFLFKFMPRLAHGMEDPANGSANDVIQSIAANLESVFEFFTGANKYLRNKKAGRSFDPNRSWVRLRNPDGRKLGGGVRVKRLELNDSWDNLASKASYPQTAAVYAQEYSYTLQNSDWSSGVAAYEPMAGGEEIPQRTPVFSRVERMYVPDDEHYVETPFGESFFPSPLVGYSRVSVRSITPDSDPVPRTGITVNEFYTARDFPTRTSRTSLLPVEKKTSDLGQLLQFDVKDYMTATQGYVVETNDMHGKQKAVWNLAQNGDRMSGSEYSYKTKTLDVPIPYAPPGTDPVQKEVLDNWVRVIRTDGTMTESDVGVDMDVVTDFRQQFTRSSTFGIHANLYFFMAGIVPVLVPPIIPSFANSKTRFRSAVTTKVIQRYGLIDEVVSYDLGSRVSVQNRAYDAVTGNVILAATINEFDDPIYQFTYPAHWGYDRMGQASRNEGTEIRNRALDFSCDEFATSYDWTFNWDAALDVDRDVFTKGDELLWTAGTTTTRVWVFKADANTGTGQQFQLIEEDGGSFGSTSGERVAPSYVKIVRSGRRNQHSAPIGTITLKHDPLPSSINGSLDLDQDVLNSTATSFQEQWRVFDETEPAAPDPSSCFPQETTASEKQILNPFLAGIWGKWRPYQQYACLTERTPATPPSTNIREDGVYDGYAPIWTPPGGGSTTWSKMVQPPWQLANTAKEYHPIGQGIEDEDAIGIRSAAQMGYGGDLTLAIASNARHRDMAFESFEDEKACGQDHLGLADQIDGLVDDQIAHCGRHSLALEDDADIQISTVISDPDACGSFTPSSNAPYILQWCDLIGHFEPKQQLSTDDALSKKWILSMWVRGETPDDIIPTSYEAPLCSLAIAGGFWSVLVPGDESPVIDGWQQMNYVFSYEGDAAELFDLVIKNETGGELHIDDLRIHPFLSEMKSYVYDPVTLRLMAELDGRNYATFYEYDEEGTLLRVKRETERAVMTTQTSRSSTHHNP